MIRLSLRTAFLGSVVIFASGCGDSARTLWHEYITLKHEFADHLSKIVDEDSAALFMTVYKEKIKGRVTRWLDRFERYEKMRMTDGEKATTIQFLKAAGDEAMAREIRLTDSDVEDLLEEMRTGNFQTKSWEDRWGDPQSRQDFLAKIPGVQDYISEYRVIFSPPAKADEERVLRRVEREFKRIRSVVAKLKEDNPLAEGEWPKLATVAKGPGAIFADMAELDDGSDKQGGQGGGGQQPPPDDPPKPPADEAMPQNSFEIQYKDLGASYEVSVTNKSGMALQAVSVKLKWTRTVPVMDDEKGIAAPLGWKAGEKIIVATVLKADVPRNFSVVGRAQVGAQGYTIDQSLKDPP